MKIDLTTSKKTETVTRSTPRASSILRAASGERRARRALGDARLKATSRPTRRLLVQLVRCQQAKQSQRALDDLRRSAPNIKIVQQQGSRTVDDLCSSAPRRRCPVQKCLSKLTGVPYRKAVDPDRAVASAPRCKPERTTAKWRPRTTSWSSARSRPRCCGILRTRTASTTRPRPRGRRR